MIRNVYAYMGNCMLMHFTVTCPPERSREMHTGEVAQGVYFQNETTLSNMDHRV